MKIEEGAHVTPNVRLVRMIGEGGMGSVWLADHLALGTEVAVKFLSGAYATNPDARARFSQEAAAASQVKSSHVVKVYDYGITDTDVPFIVMEMLEGGDLASRIAEEKKLSSEVVVTIVNQLCKALGRAHEKGVIHRDIKPENVFLGSEGGEIFVKLLDFGIAKTETVLRKTTGNRRSTMAGESLGTPYYMSPEQFRSAKLIDARSDLWAVGVLAYEAMTGVLPFEGETVSALALAVNEGIALPPSSVEPSIPAGFDAWFAKACAHDPKDRFQSARELSSALRVAFGGAPESTLSDPGASGGRRVIISHVDPLEAGQIAMRDTAFATSGGQVAKPTRRVVPIAAAIVVVASVVGVALWVNRAPAASRASTTATAETTTTTTATATQPITPIAAASSSATPSIATTTTTATIAIATPATNHAATTSTSHAAHGAPSASASAKGDHHGDIW